MAIKTLIQSFSILFCPPLSSITFTSLLNRH
uniref:Uncharacterized protein n=1 Tax=Salix viminalis TaxID=40686 RepID=A0A6N2MT85_SALVM